MEKTALRKALETTGDGAALLPYDLESYLGEELMKVQPLAELIPVLQAESKTHEYNLRTSHPMGWFEGESTPANFKNGTYARKSTMLKIQRIWGSVTGFARSMDEAFIDAFTTELEGSLQGMADVFEFGILYACSGEEGFTGDPFQYSGLFPRLAAGAPTNIIDAGGAKVSLGVLDPSCGRTSTASGLKLCKPCWDFWIQKERCASALTSLPPTTPPRSLGQSLTRSGWVHPRVRRRA